MILGWFPVTCKSCGHRRKYTRRRICRLCRSAASVSVAPRARSSGSRSGFDAAGFVSDVISGLD